MTSEKSPSHSLHEDDGTSSNKGSNSLGPEDSFSPNSADVKPVSVTCGNHHLAQSFAELLQSLRDMSNPNTSRGGSTVRKNECFITTSEGILQIDSWQFPEYRYLKYANTLPCKARGLFTTTDRIVARGYDKFFNVNEAEVVSDEVLRQTCVGPFTATTKENGCIIFLAGLADSTLVVCSKNLTGDADSEMPRSRGKHYKRGIQAIEKQLTSINKSPQDLARALFEKNATAVAELCDDEFEEHILEYPKKNAGLYLHGINFNQIAFSTAPMHEVSKFGDEWGFKQVQYTQHDTYDELMEFVKEIDNNGTYEGREIEGFVVRCKRKSEAPNGELEDYFFKYKYEQPYLLFRQLREATLKFYDEDYVRPLTDIRSLFPKFQRITYAYLKFAGEYFEADPQRVKQYHNNIGIIKLRKLFVEKLLAGSGQGVKPHEMETDQNISESFDRMIKNTETVYCVITIAAPGCGKTTTCMTLAGLTHEWEHVQNDNHGKGEDIFETTLKLLSQKKLVFFDRMNYRQSYRKDLFHRLCKERGAHLMPNVEIKLIGLNFLNTTQPQSLYELLEKRIMERGDNHQSVAARSKPEAARALLSDTLRKFQPPTLNDESEEKVLPRVVQGSELSGVDSELSLLINVDLEKENSSLVNAKIIYDELTRAYPELCIDGLTDAIWNESFDRALKYQPVKRKQVNSPSRSVQFYGIGIERDAIVEHLNDVLKNNKTWQDICDKGRVQDEFHVTLSHAQSVRQNKEKYQQIWQDLGRIFSKNSFRRAAVAGTKVVAPIFTDVTIKRIVVFESLLVALEVNVPYLYRLSSEGEPKGKEPVPTSNTCLHVTIGTVNQSIAPRMSNIYLTELLARGDISDGLHESLNFNATVVSWNYFLSQQQGFIYFN